MCEGDGSASVGFRGGVVAVSEYMGGTRGSGVLASACDVLEISVVRGVDVCHVYVFGSGRGGNQNHHHPHHLQPLLHLPNKLVMTARLTFYSSTLMESATN